MRLVDVVLLVILLPSPLVRLAASTKDASRDFTCAATSQRCDDAMEKNPPRHHRFPNVETLSAGLMDFVAELSNRAIEERGEFVVALSGGSLPATLGGVGKLAGAFARRKDVEFEKWKVFFADERAVPHTHADSNLRAVNEAFLSAVKVGAVFGYPESSASVAVAAASYASAFKKAASEGRFDLVLLGMGPDGHTASLFPGHPLLKETTLAVAPIADSPKPPPQRITFTYPVINNARSVAFVVTGASKAEVVAQSAVPLAKLPVALEESLPAARVRPVDGELHWFLDEEAASRL